jgi:hypothetical protein
VVNPFPARVFTTLQRAAVQGPDWQTAEALSDKELAARLFPAEEDKPRYKLPDYEYIHREMSKPGVTQQLLWFEYCDRCRDAGEIPYQLTQFKTHYRGYIAQTKATMHISRKPGELMEVDWAGQTATLTDTDTGGAMEAYIFVSALPYNRLFSSAMRADGSEKWVDFISVFWHCACVCGLLGKAFTSQYQKWCKKNGYNFNEEKALDIYATACEHISVMPKTNAAKLLVEQAVSQLRATSAAVAALQKEMQTLAASLPEYPVVMQMYGVGPVLGPQLMAEIGDVRRFHSKKALVAFAGIDAPPYQSGTMDIRSRSISKCGSPSLRRTLFLVMSIILQNSQVEEPVYQFMTKKRAEGKPYRVYVMASANKFLRIYYARVKAHLETLAAA